MNHHAAEILLVEDNISDADLTIRALKKNNLANSIVHLKDGQEALDYIFSEDNIKEMRKTNFIKVILLDLKMPKVSGLEVLQKLKSDKQTAKIPIVILTSSREDPDISKCYELGANSYVVKPVAFDSFSQAIAQLGLYWLIINETVKKV